MLHLAIIGIVCAVSAPSEGTAIIGRKNYESNASCHFVAKPSLPRVYNVDAHNSSLFAKEKITNRTGSFRCDYTNKQYQRSRSDLCSIMENVSSREKKESPDSNVGLAFRKRNLLWSVESRFSPKTLRPPMNTVNDYGCEKCRSKQPKCSKHKTKCRKSKCRCGTGKKKKCMSETPLKSYNLNCVEKKKFLRLKTSKERNHKRHLDKVKIDDELDLNKRIQKLVEEIAIENQRAATETITPSASGGGAVASSEGKTTEKVKQSFPFFKNFKKIFRFSKNYFNNKKLNIDKPVPVNTVRGEDPVADKTALVNSFDVFKTMRKTIRFRRTPHRNYVSYSQGDNPVSRYREKVFVKPFPNSFILKKNGKSCGIYNHQKLLKQIIRSHRLLYGLPVGEKRRILNVPFFLRRTGKDVRSKRHNECPVVDMTNDDTTTEDDLAKNRKNEESSSMTKSNDGTDSPPTVAETSEHLDAENFKEYDINDNNEDAISEHTLEKPILERDFRRDSPRERTPTADLKMYEDRYNLQTDFPLFSNPTALHPHRRYKYDLPKDGFLNPYRYLKIRHALRNYLIHNNILSPIRLNSPCERRKRCGGKCCPLPHKCWRSPPLLCIPYIRKGQDDLLRYMIKTMQKLIGKPFPPKIDIFDNTKFKPCEKKLAEHTCEEDDDDDNCETRACNGPPCVPVQACPPGTPRPCPVSRCPSNGCIKEARPCPRRCSYEYFSPASEYVPYVNPFPSTPPCSYSYDNMGQIFYTTESYCGYDEPIATIPSPCMPSDPYYQSFVSLPPLWSPSQTSTSYPSTPPSNAYPEGSEQTPMGYTRTPFGPPSTANAYSWYMSKSPVDRAEYFSFTALPFDNQAEWVTAPSQLVQSGPIRPANIQPSFSHSPAQVNPPISPKINAQLSPIYAEYGPTQMPPVINSQPVTGHFLYDNQYQQKSFGEPKEPDEITPEQMNQIRKEDQPQRTLEYGVNFNSKPQNAGSYDEHNGVNQNQLPKPVTNCGYAKDGSKENLQYAYKCTYDQTVPTNQQIPKVEANSEYVKTLSKEDNPTVPNTQPLPPTGVGIESNKNHNGDYGFKCASPQYPSNDQQLPKPDTNIKYVKNPDKQETFKCADQAQVSSDQQLTKPDLNEGDDDRRFFKTKHHKGLLKNFKKPAMEFFQTYDDYYDKHSFVDPEEYSSLRYNKAPFPRTWRGYGRSIKKNSKRGSSTRHKRGDNYYWSDGLENYNDYESDVSYNEELSSNSKSLEEAPPDVNWTPPSYEMFSELAKVVTEANGTESTDTNIATKTSAETFVSISNQTAEKQFLKNLAVNSLDEIPSKINDDIKIKSLNSNASATSTSFNNAIHAVNNNKERNTRNNATAESDVSVTTDSSANATTNREAKTITNATPECDPDNGESIDSKKSGKTGFFQTNSKSVGIQSNSGHVTTIKTPKSGSAKDGKEQDGIQDSDSAEEGQVPTTMKIASIVKGPKKQMTKPSPKVYTKVYPDSLAIETEANEAATTTAVTTAKAVVEKTTQALGSTSDVQLQLLAVCEGYLEVVKLIKAQNQTLGEDLDTDLARYCENIISQNFNLQSDSSKSKKQESIHSSSVSPATSNSTGIAETTENSKKRNSNNVYSRLTSDTKYLPENEITKQGRRGKVVVDILNDPSLHKKELFENTKRKRGNFKKKRLNCAEREDRNNEGYGVFGDRENSHLRRKKNNKPKSFYPSTRSKFKSPQKKSKRCRRKGQTDEELLEKGITKQQVELLRLLRKRKKALLSWLYSSKEVPDRQNHAQETEYFDDEEEIPQTTDFPVYSGTITRRESEETPTAAETELSFVNESIFPVYAKEYGYDRGGELTEVEVLWRKINEKTHEKKVFKNRSVLALLLTSTREPNTIRDDSRLIPDGFENEEIPETQSKSENKVGFAEVVANLNKKTSTPPNILKIRNCSSANNTYTYINKPDPSSIVGTPPNATTTHPNVTRKISHKFGVAKDLFQEYTLEFLNYAVYILPIMFTVLFVFCCLCCAVQILKSSKSNRRYKKKKRLLSTEESDTSEEGERKAKKKRREARRLKHAKDNPGCENLDKKRSKTFWNVLKLNSAKPNAEFNGDCQTEKKKSFLRFLKGRKDECKAEEYSPGYSTIHEVDVPCADQQNQDGQYHGTRRRNDGQQKTYTQIEAEERRELIALLEELKKIETENTAEKKEVKSVHVQYMTQEDDTPVFPRPEFAFPYQKNVFGMPKGYSPCIKHFPFYQSDPAAVRDYELFEDVNELTELLPCECSYYSKRNDCLRHCDFKINQEGGCKGFIKIFRDAGVSHSKPFKEKNLFKNESENRSFIFNKYRSISTDTSEELMGVTQKNAGTGIRLTDGVYESASPFKLHTKRHTGLVEETDSLKRQLKNKKHVRLKDDGVLCRL